MKKIGYLLVIALAVLFVAPLHAALLKVSVAEFKVTGAANRDELKSTLAALLASRLANDSLQVVDFGEAADLTVTGTYIAFGKIFSLDARVADSAGKVVGRAFEQGESADDVIPAVSRLAKKLAAEISRSGNSNAAVTAAAAAQLPAAAVVAASADIVRPAAVTMTKPEGDIIRPEAASTRAIASGMIGQRLDGTIIAVSQGKRTAAGERELVAALAGELRLYSQGKELRLLNSVKDFSNNDKLVAVDTADLDGDGIVEVYVTCFRGDELASRVYLLENGSFRKIAAKLPYFFRAIKLKGESTKIYAQQMGREDDYYGGLYEVVKKGDKFSIVNEIKLPKFANIFNYNQIADRNGKSYAIVLHPDNYILVYDDMGGLLWKSSEKYGGSATYFLRDDLQNQRVTGSTDRKVFLEQRITITKAGTIIIPQNEGSFVVGNNRAFTKNSIYAFSWNGAALDELWHTKQSQNYLTDYLYDDEQKELLLVEIVKKEGVSGKGASAISIKRVE